MKLSPWQRYLLSILSGLLLVVSFPFTGSLFPLVFIAWVPLLIVEHDIFTQKYSPKKVFIHALIVFFIYNAGTSYWLYYSHGAGGIPIVAHIINALLMTGAFMLFHWTKRSLGSRIGLLTLIIFWVGFEYIHYNWELSTPWFTQGNVFSVAPQFVQWYSYTGVLGGSLWIIIANLAFFKFAQNLLFKKKTFRTQYIFLLLGLGVVLIPSALSLWSYTTYKETKNPINIVVTQPNVEQYHQRREMYLKDQLDRCFDEAKKLITDSTSIVLAPETVIPNLYPVNENKYEEDTAFNYIQRNVNEWGNASLYIGLASYKTFKKKTRFTIKKFPNKEGFYEQYDASALVTPKSRPIFIHKTKLLLMAEKIPFAKYFPSLEMFAVNLRGTSGTLGSGNKPVVLRTHGFNFATANCYESIYGEWIAEECRKGAEVIFAISNDGWWGNSAGYKQHASFSRLRAIENRKYVARSAMTGISCIINQRGDVLNATDYGVKTAFRATIQLNKHSTFYTKYGDYIGRLFLFFFFLFIGIDLILLIRKRIVQKTNKVSKK